MDVRRALISGRGFEAGKRELAAHRPDRALRLLRESVEACPAEQSALLAQRLYWLAVTLLRMDRPELALKSLASAQKLRPRGLARKAYKHRVNEYGMPRRDSVELDDFYAFYSIRTCLYLGSCSGHRFATVAEKDRVTRIIAAAWKELRQSRKLEGLSTDLKLLLYKSWGISFPSFGLDATFGSCPDPIAVDFKRGRSVRGDDRCTCGSGLAYRLCCGRTISPLELRSE